MLKELQERRLEAEYSGMEVWAEWKEHPGRDIHNPRWEGIIEDRIQRLEIRLQSDTKRKEFGLLSV